MGNNFLDFHIIRPMTPDNADILISGTVHVKEATNGDGTRRHVPKLEPMGQHLVCFAGGMLAVGGQLTRNQAHLEAARQLVDGCIWAYRHMPLGIMPESFSMKKKGNARGTS
ncbi:putative glycoside hydrolase family 47 protein [Eutypa lata UCREL1]|uniref:Putative glycoside hydrolase family 47 protein n=1 Tax=Eutypa lata (strain UCR-EL1) TaxID=1287681 RepID=M7T6V2_EUTLA|nr:putative glycoside hydrolase family 47 protein [Eutypa lata UCREL1]